MSLLRSALRPFAVLVALVAVVAHPGPARAGGDPAASADDGSAAPAGSWVCEGGCAARTGASRTEALRGPVEVAWTRELARPICGEPVVHESTVFVEMAATTATGPRSLVAIRLSDGAVLAETKVGSVPLRACIARGLVVACADKDAVNAYRVLGSRLAPVWTTRIDAPVESTATIGNELYLRTSGSVMRFEVGGSDAPVWRVDGLTACGTLAVRAGQVFVVDAGRADARLLAFDRTTGSRVASVPMGRGPPAGLGDRVTSPAVTVTESRVFLQRPGGYETASVGFAPSACATRNGPAVVEAGLGFQASRPIEVPGGWISADSKPGGPPDVPAELVLVVKPDGSGYTLATADGRRGWLARWERASQAGGVVLHPAGTFDVATRRVLWTTPVEPEGRLIPARDRVVFVQSARKLAALGPRGTAAMRTVPLGPGLPDTAFDGLAVLADGSQVEGSLRRDGAALALPTTPPRRVTLDDVLIVEDAGRHLLHAASYDALDRALAAMDRARRAQELETLMAASFGSRDADALERLLVELRVVGGRDELVRRANARVRDLRKTEKTKPDPDLSKRIDEALERCAATSVQADRLRALPADAPRELVLWYCRRVLAVSPHDAEAARRVASLLPAGLAPAAPFDAAEWLDIAEVVGRMPIEIVLPPAPGAADLTRVQRAVGVQSVTWRKDVIGLHSPQLLVITPLQRPAAVARCLALGEMACETMQGWCAEGRRVRDTREPLTLLVYETKEEYQRACAGKAVRMGHDMSWSGGHYSPGESLSRLYLPDDDVQMRRGLEVFVHELCHHWIEERCPLFGDSDRKRGAKLAGYWIVEGFADFVENLRFDPARGTWALDPFAEPLEVVAGAPRDRLLPWDEVFGMDYDRFIALDRAYEIPVTPVRSLTGTKEYSRMHVFYMQSSAVCRYLFDADGGALRPRLLAYLAAKYGGEVPSIQDAFGMSPAELGKRVIAYCEATLRDAK